MLAESDRCLPHEILDANLSGRQKPGFLLGPGAGTPLFEQWGKKAIYIYIYIYILQIYLYIHIIYTYNHIYILLYIIHIVYHIYIYTYTYCHIYITIICIEWSLEFGVFNFRRNRLWRQCIKPKLNPKPLKPSTSPSDWNGCFCLSSSSMGIPGS